MEMAIDKRQRLFSYETGILMDGNGIKYQEIHLGRKARNNTPVKVKNITTMLVCQWNVNLKHR